MKTAQFKLKGYDFKLKNDLVVSFLVFFSNVLNFSFNRLDCNNIIFVCRRERDQGRAEDLSFFSYRTR